MTGDSPPPAGPDSAGKTGPSEGAAPAVGAFAGLGPRQCQAIEALLQGQTMSRAAVLAGVNERTLRKWVRNERFRNVLLGARREAFQQAIGLTSRYAPAAVAALVKVMNDQLASPNARVAAAAVLLKFGREGIELDDLAARIEALERDAIEVTGTVVQREPLRLTEES